MTTEARFEGGPQDGQPFTHDGFSWIETAEIDGDWLRIHGYRAIDKHKTAYQWCGVQYSVDLPEARDDQHRRVLDA